MGKLTINVLFNSYVSLPEGNPMVVGWIPNLPTVRSKDSKVPPTARPPAPAPSAAPDHATDPHPSRASVERTPRSLGRGLGSEKRRNFTKTWEMPRVFLDFDDSLILMRSYEIL